MTLLGCVASGADSKPPPAALPAELKTCSDDERLVRPPAPGKKSAKQAMGVAYRLLESETNLAKCHRRTVAFHECIEIQRAGGECELPVIETPATANILRGN